MASPATAVPPQRRQPRWRSDLNKLVITSNLELRGWQEARGSEDWDIFFASMATVQQLFSSSSLQTPLRPDQLLSHFPNSFELTHKDLLVKNINRHKCRLRKEGQAVPALIPPTFVLPQDYGLFVEEFRKHPSSTTYILKPTNKAQGKGIFLINKLSALRQRSTPATATPAAAVATSSVPPVFLPCGSASSGGSSSRPAASPPTNAMRPALDSYIVSRYIDDPLLVLGGGKFDLRLYVLVPSFQPLVVYLSSLGFARFCSSRYTPELAELDNQLVHLTNVAIQKSGKAYNASHGNKWPLQDLRLHLEATRGHNATARLFADIEVLVVHTFKAVQPVIIQDSHCFELYGFDVLIDSQLQPWLIEANASPSMTSTTTADRLLKWAVVNDSLTIVTPPHWSADTGGKPLVAASRPSSSSSSREGGGPQSAGAGSTNAGSTTPNRKQPQQQQRACRQYPCAVGCMQLIHHDDLQADRQQQRPHRPPKSKQPRPPGDARRHVVLHG